MGNAISFFAVMSYVQFVLCPALLARALLTGHHSAYECTRHICDIVGAKFLKTKDSTPLEPGCLYLCNHRSFADFFVDQALTGGAAYLSRMMVWFAVPVSSIYAWVGASTWYFNRKPGIDRAAFAKWLDNQWNTRPEFGLIAYPEGTRNLTDKPHRLKTGVLWYAWDYKRKVQVVLTANKDKMVNEKKFHLKRNQILVTHYSKVLDPADFKDREEFIEEVRKVFVESWDKCHQDPSKCAEIYDPPFGQSSSSLKKHGRTRGHRALLLRIILLIAIALIIIMKYPSLLARFVR